MVRGIENEQPEKREMKNLLTYQIIERMVRGKENNTETRRTKMAPHTTTHNHTQPHTTASNKSPNFDQGLLFEDYIDSLEFKADPLEQILASQVQAATATIWGI